MRWLYVCPIVAAALGVAGLWWLGAHAWLLVVPLAGLAAAPLLPSGLLLAQRCDGCRRPVDPELAFCGGCARSA